MSGVPTSDVVTAAGLVAGEQLHELNDFVPIVGARKGGDGTYVGGACQILFADGHVAKVNDSTGVNAEGDGYIGAYKDSSTTFAVEINGYEQELRNKIWVRQLGNGPNMGAGGGVIE
jgi:prepilin-type processing-associated H-X9-DG protein